MGIFDVGREVVAYDICQNLKKGFVLEICPSFNTFNFFFSSRCLRRPATYRAQCEKRGLFSPRTEKYCAYKRDRNAIFVVIVVTCTLVIT